MKSSTYYFHKMTKILADFQICGIIHLTKLIQHQYKRYHTHETIYETSMKFKAETKKRRI